MAPRNSSGGTVAANSVVSLSTHARYQPDWDHAANARLRAAREALGMDHAGFAAWLSKTLGRKVTAALEAAWESGSTPPGNVILACISLIGEGGAALVPEQGPLRSYDGRGKISREQWNDIISGATEHLWLYGMAEQGYANDDEVPGILADAASTGCSVRVLLLDPASPIAFEVDGDEENPPGTLAARIRGALAKFSKMRQLCPEIEIRTYDTHPTLSIVRGDDAMLVTPYLRYMLGSNSPTFAVTAQSAAGMWGRWERHFESMWNHSREQG